MDLLDIIGKFQLNNLSQEWISNQWYQDFSSDKELPSDYAYALDDENYGDLLDGLSLALKDWLTSEELPSNEPSGSGAQLDASSHQDRRSWQTLLTAEVNHRALVAVVSSFLRADVKVLTDDVTRRYALSASRCYFLLLSVRGAQIYNVFSSALFAQALESLKVLSLLGDSQDKVKPTKPKGRKKKNAQEEPEEPPPEIDDTDVVHISSAEKAELIKWLIVVLDDLKFCLNIFPLKENDDALNSAIAALVSIARLEKTTASFVQHASRNASITYLSHSAYKILIGLCDQRHGSVPEVVRLICRFLLPHLTMSAQEMHTNDKTKSIVRAHMIAFIKLMIETHGESTYKGVQALVQQLCIRTPEKADIRARCVQQVLTLLSHFPLDLFTKCSLWICSFTFSEAVRNRVMGLELLNKLLHSDEKQGEVTDTVVPSRLARSSRSSADKQRPIPSPEEDDSSSDRGEDDEVEPDPCPSTEPNILENGSSTTLFVSHKFFLSSLLSRMLDQSPTVRAKCLAMFAPLILLKHQVIKDIMQGMFVSSYTHFINPIEGVMLDDRTDFDFRLFFLRKHTTPPNRNPLPGGSIVVNRVQKLTKDQKVFVRKSSLNVLCNVCRLNSKWISQEKIEIMVLSCLDFSVIVRKMMIQCLTDLVLDYPHHDLLVKAWVQGIVPLVADNELKCQEKAIEAVTSVVVGNLIDHDLVANSLHLLPWRVIKLLNVYQLRNVFRFVCRHWVTTKRIGIKEMKTLSTHIKTENDHGAWYFIVCISEFTDFHQPDMIVHYYLDNIYDKPTVPEYCSQLVLEALFLNWRHIDSALIDDLVQSKLLPSLERCALPLTSISIVMDICSQYNNETFSEVAKRIITKCDDYLKQTVGPNSPEKCRREDALAQHILILGDATSVCPNQLSQSSVSLLCDLIDKDYFESENGRWKGNVGRVCRAVTVGTLGKFCLQDQFLAKKLVPLLGTLLNATTPTEVKLNTITTMTDLCIRFTSMVEPYLGDMCVCLKDSDVRVRKTTLDQMIRLIQEDYVKLKCPYIYYVLQMLEDPELQIRTTIKAFIMNTVVPKNPRIMVQEFIQALYFLNDYEHNDVVGLAFNSVAMNPNEKKAFKISGIANRDRRRKLLTFMIDNMTDDHKFKTLNSICNEIFDGVSEDRIVLQGAGTLVVQDAIFILGCDELRMNTTKKQSEEDDDESNAAERVDNRMVAIVDALLKKLYQCNVMPSVIKFKRKLQESKSTLLREFMTSMSTMMKEFKDWMQEILSGDPTLASEIELDMRMLNNEETEDTISEKTEELPSTPSVLNDSNKLNMQPVVCLPRLSIDANGEVTKSPRASQSTRRGSTVAEVTNDTRIRSPCIFMSDDEMSSPSTPSNSPQVSKKGTRNLRGSPKSAGSSSPVISPTAGTSREQSSAESPSTSANSVKRIRQKKTESSDSPNSEASGTSRAPQSSSPPRKRSKKKQQRQTEKSRKRKT